MSDPGHINYPSSLDTLETLLRIGYGTETYLLQPIEADTMTMKVGDTTRLTSPSGVIFCEGEWITYEAISGNTLTLAERGAFVPEGGYPAQAHPHGAIITQTLTPMHHRVLADAIIAVESFLIGITPFSESVQDIVGALLQDTTSIDVTYNDAGAVESIAVKFAGTGSADTAARSDHTHSFTFQKADTTQFSSPITTFDFGPTGAWTITESPAGEANLTIIFGTGAGTVAEGNHAHTGVYQPLDADLTAIAALGDPNADRIIFWDDSLGAMAYLAPDGTTLVISGTTISVVTEGIQDIVGAMVADSTSIDATYNDAGNVESLEVITEAIQDIVGAMVADSTSIDAVYNDAGNAETLAVIYGGSGAANTASRSDHGHNNILRTDTVSIANGASAQLNVDCVAGEVCTGGGCHSPISTMVIFQNHPLGTAGANATGWSCEASNSSGASRILTTYAICMIDGT